MSIPKNLDGHSDEGEIISKQNGFIYDQALYSLDIDHSWKDGNRHTTSNDSGLQQRD